MWEVALSRTVMKRSNYLDDEEQLIVCACRAKGKKKFSDCLAAECFENTTSIYFSAANTKSNRQLLPTFLKPALH
ncbi:hypothetical protein AKJ16_DCAP17759 [Drosera capensis]